MNNPFKLLIVFRAGSGCDFIMEREDAQAIIMRWKDYINSQKGRLQWEEDQISWGDSDGSETSLLLSQVMQMSMKKKADE